MTDYADLIAASIAETESLPDGWDEITPLIAQAIRTGYNLRDGVGK